MMPRRIKRKYEKQENIVSQLLHHSHGCVLDAAPLALKPFFDHLASEKVFK